MAPAVAKKRKIAEGMQGKTSRPSKKLRKQHEYHSDSDDNDEPGDFQAVSLADSDDDERPAPKKKTLGAGQKPKPAKEQKKEENEEEESDASSIHSDDDDGDRHDEADSNASDEGADDEDDNDNESITSHQRALPKRNDPSAFSSSISKILSTKLPTSARADPVLSRSKSAQQSTTDIADEKLDRQARAKLKAEKKEELDRGRVRDVLGIARGQTGAVAEEEKKLRKTAQRGVVKLFNAVRTAQVRGEEAVKAERKKGTVGIGEREKAANEVSRQGFLELISGKKGKPLNIEEA